MPVPMAPDLSAVEAALLAGDKARLSEWTSGGQGTDVQQLATRLASLVASGQYLDVLKEPEISSLIGADIQDAVTSAEAFSKTSWPHAPDLKQRIRGNITSFVSGVHHDNEWRQLVCVMAGAAAVSAFMQENVTGPPILEAWSNWLPESLWSEKQGVQRQIVEGLGVDGEECYRLANSHYFVWLARTVLEDAAANYPACWSGMWWSARTCYINQQLLSDWANTLYTTYKSNMDKVIAVMQDDSNLGAGERTQLVIRAHIEYGIMGYYYKDVAREMTHVVSAQELSGLVLEMTGVLGRRTRWQTFDTPQLVLKAKSDQAPEGAPANEAKPINMQLNDDTLLEEIKFTEHVDDQSDLALLDQCIILASCLNVKNSNPKHGLTTEQMMPFVERVLRETNKTHNWLIYSMGLLLRSRLEAERSRTVERGVLQMQVLIDQSKDEAGKKEAAVWQRMEYAFCLAFPMFFNLQRELGHRYQGIGVLRSAQEIYERLEMWEDVIQCLVAMDETTKALALCKERLGVEQTPRLLCVLGDLTNDKTKYEEAWELSGHRFPRAMASLGRALLRDGDAAGCVRCLQQSTAINPLNEANWFTMGCAALQTEDYETAVTAFRRCVNLNEENSEAWNNMGSAYIKMGDMVKAAQALAQALKSTFDNWKMWENYLNVTTEIKDYNGAMQALHRLMDIKAQKFDDVIAVKANMQVIIDRLAAVDDDRTKQAITKKWGELMGRCQSVMSQNPDIWAVCAEWYRFKEDDEKVLDCLVKSHRVSQKTGWEKDGAMFEDVAKRALILCEAYIARNNSQSIRSARLMLRTLTKKSEEYFGETETYRRLQEAFEKVNNMESDGL